MALCPTHPSRTRRSIALGATAVLVATVATVAGGAAPATAGIALDHPAPATPGGATVELSPGAQSKLADDFTGVLVTATVHNRAGRPVAGKVVTITVVEGPDKGTTTTGPTASDGTYYLYLLSPVAGRDTVVATFARPGGGLQTSNRATVTWVQPAPTGCRIEGGAEFTDTTYDAEFTVDGYLSSDVTQPQQMTVDLQNAYDTAVLTSLTSAACHDDPTIDPGQGQRYDTFTGAGDATFDGRPGYTLRFEIKDGGERPYDGMGSGLDRISDLSILDPHGYLVYQLRGPLDLGNEDMRDGSS